MRADRFLNEFRQALRESFFLKFILLITILVVIAQFVIVVFLWTHQKIILVPTAKFTKEVVLTANSADPQYIRIFLRDFLKLYTTYTPKDVDYRLKEALFYISPRFYHEAEVSFAKRAKDIKEVGVSQYSEIRNIEILSNNDAIAEVYFVRYISGEAVDQGTKYFWVKFHFDNGRFYVDFVKPLKQQEVYQLKQKLKGGI